MNAKLLETVEDKYLNKDHKELNLKIGSTVKLGLKVVEGSKDKNKERIQYFEGILIRMSGSGVRKNVTVRRIASNGVGVEKIVPLHSPVLHSIEVIGEQKARRAKLYYIRNRTGRAAMQVR